MIKHVSFEDRLLYFSLSWDNITIMYDNMNLSYRKYEFSSNSFTNRALVSVDCGGQAEIFFEIEKDNLVGMRVSLGRFSVVVPIKNYSDFIQVWFEYSLTTAFMCIGLVFQDDRWMLAHSDN